MLLLGIDLGGRTTNKTAVSLLDSENRSVEVYSSEDVGRVTAKNDANFINFVNNLNADIIGIDAPLSLPDFTKPDYLYRKADKVAGALSPMTIGEITARAIFLSHNLNAPTFEVYPKSLLKLHNLPSTGYKNDPSKLITIVEAIKQIYSIQINDFPLTGDNVDSILCSVVLLHYIEGNYEMYGEENGFILPG
ncbi:MAG: hypothetical protein SCALA702_27710 [Melioribacteraceae bacterium]|nr:MAG: hypothetical protein SCALA702_27710 [Melioribacteraceae bacterium]